MIYNQKGFWSGYVKNLRKYRGYYWVFATVLKRIASDGTISYLSIRLKPSIEAVASCTKLYSELRSKE